MRIIKYIILGYYSQCNPAKHPRWSNLQLTVFEHTFILDVWRGSEYASALPWIRIRTIKLKSRSICLSNEYFNFHSSLRWSGITYILEIIRKHYNEIYYFNQHGLITHGVLYCLLTSQPAITCSKLTIETLQQGVK